MLVFAHIYNGKVSNNILYFFDKLKENFDIKEIFLFLKDGEIFKCNNVKIMKIDNELMDFSTYLYGVNLATNLNDDCIFVNDTFFENKLFFKYRIRCFIKKIKLSINRNILIGHLVRKKNIEFISTYLFFINKASAKIINCDEVLTRFRNQGIGALNNLIDNNDKVNSIYCDNFSIYSIDDDVGIKWHRNKYVNEDIRKRKLICSILEQYLSYLFINKLDGIENTLRFANLSAIIYRIENKLCFVKYKFLNRIN